MDTGSIMQNQMDDMISQGEVLMEEIVNEALEIYKEHKVTPEQLLEHNKRLTEALENLLEYRSIGNQAKARELLNQESKCECCEGTGKVEGEHFDDIQPCRTCTGGSLYPNELNNPHDNVG